MNELKTFKTEQCDPINIGGVSGSIFFYQGNSAGSTCHTYIKFFELPFLFKNNEKEGRFEFTRPTLDSRNVIKALKKCNRYQFYLSGIFLDKGHYSDIDIDIENESLFLYYR